MMQKMEDWVFSHYGQEAFHPGLDRIDLALEPLKRNLQKSKIITIAGTNGKGETTHRLGKLLSNESFCAWTSPHVNCLSERFSSERGDIGLEELRELLLECHEEAKQKSLKLTYYEFLFFAFCRWACKLSPQYLLLEVGLGGRLDAVNVLDADLVLLTSISRDHQEFLGPRYDLILSEKLGVLRPSGRLISFLDLKYLRERVEQKIEDLGVWHLDLADVSDLKPFEFSQRNQLLACAAYCQLKGLDFELRDWPNSQVKLTSRGEVIKGINEWWLYGSHNVDGMRKLIHFLSSANYNLKDSPFRVIVTSFSKRSERDVQIMLKMLKRANLGEVVVTALNHPKAYPHEDLERLALQEGLKFVSDISTIVQGWTHQRILVAGSYYLLGQLRPYICGQ